MNLTWLNWRNILLDDPRLSFHAKSIGMFLNTYMNDQNDFAFPSIATIQGRLNLGSDKTVTKYINELVEHEYLVKQRRYGQSIIYHAILPSIVRDTIIPVSHDVRDSIAPRTVSVSHHVRTNNQENNQTNNQDNKKGNRFVPPTITQVRQYCQERINQIDPENFIDHYEASGWMRGTNKIKDWKACVRTWERNTEKGNGANRQTTSRAERVSNRLDELAEQAINNGGNL